MLEVFGVRASNATVQYHSASLGYFSIFAEKRAYLVIGGSVTGIHGLDYFIRNTGIARHHPINLLQYTLACYTLRKADVHLAAAPLGYHIYHDAAGNCPEVNRDAH